MRSFAAAGLAIVMVVAGACGKKSGRTETTIGTPDAPGKAGPPAPTRTTAAASGAPGRRTPAPWSAPTQNVSALIARAGLPALPQERLEYHVHSHIDVQVDGVAESVHADLGIDRQARVLSPLHTHDDSGIIHVENDVAKTFYLGQLFTEWDVRLDAGCVGGY